jgi:hypothetical protein
MHIEESLKLGAIRESQSPHRLVAFIVWNHAKIVRENQEWLLIIKG